jgi:NADH-quinone oxidoreductase subunit G
MQVLTEHEKQALYIAAPVATKLDDAASMAFQAAPDDLARLGFAVAHAIDPQAPAVADLAQSEGERAQEIAEALKSAERPLVVSGVSCGGPALLQAAANVSRALHNTGHPSGLIFVLPEANSFGLGILGGGSLQDAFRALKEGKGDLLITLENDLYRRSNRQELEDCLKAGVKHISINYLEDAMTVQANLVFPSATYAETDGTYVNNEGRAQRAYQVFAPDGEVRDAWRWLNEIMCRMGMMHKDDWKNVDDLRAELAQALPQFAPILEIAPPASFRMAGEKIARQTFRATGRTAEYANVMMDEPPPPDDPDAPFTFSMEGFHGDPPSSALIPRFWAPGWNSVQALNKFQEEIAGPLRGGDPGRRLIEPAGQTGSLAYFKEAPQPFHPQTDHWLLVFLYHIFGSEPLSMLTPGVAQLAPKPYVAINSDEADRLGVQEGEALVLSVDGENYSLPARRVDSLPAGMLGAPFGITPLAGVGSPIWVQIEKEGQAA